MHDDALTAQRRRWFRWATLATPLLFLLVCELGLRGVGLGGRPPLFVASPTQEAFLQANPRLARRYVPSAFADPEVRIDPVAFRADKRADGFRIVVQGASTAAGFPFGPWVGLAGMLGDRLEAAFPEREIEVISTAMAAVNSYTLLDLVDEIIAIEPDAVLIYAGHNEYLGLLGAGSALTSQRSRAATRLHIALKRWAVYEALGLAVSSVRGVGATAAAPLPERPASLMARAASGAEIPLDSPAYLRGLEQFEANLHAILARYAAAGIPVYIGTLISNVRDVPPFASRDADGVDPEQILGRRNAYAAALAGGDDAATRRALEDWLATDDCAADAWYALGRRELAAGDSEAAGVALRNARDCDQLRFRAPSAFNGVIRELAARHGAILVDVQAHLAAEVPGGIPGNEVLLEHVHPNALGYFLLADAYLEALKQHADLGDFSRAPSRERARRDMPVTALDRVLADYDVRELKSDFPFRATRSEFRLPPPRTSVERLAQQYHRGEIAWIDAMEALLQGYRRAGRIADAAVVARVVARSAPTVAVPNYVTGVLLMQLGELPRARHYLERSLKAEPENAAALAALRRLDAMENPAQP